MPRWVSIATADLEDTTLEKLVTALRTKALGTGQTDPSPRIIADIVKEVRRKVASCRNNTVDTDETTVPASLKRLTVDLVIFEMMARLRMPLSTDDDKKLSRHTRTLDRIASCEDVVEQADTAETPEVQSTAGTPSISNEGRVARRAARSGL
jgi:hypothetical protein